MMLLESQEHRDTDPRDAVSPPRDGVDGISENIGRRSEVMSRPLTESRLRAENRHYANTGGVSSVACREKLLPAFRDAETGRVEVARFRDGRPAPMHVIEGLPDEWATAYDAEGHIEALKASIVSGFVRANRFYTRAEAKALCC